MYSEQRYTDKDDANDLQKRGQTRTKGMKKATVNAVR